MEDDQPIPPEHAAFYRRRLSGRLAEINRLVGLEATRKIALRYAGSAITFPQKFNPDFSLPRLIGQESAKKLSDHFGPGRTEISTAGPFGARYSLQLQALDLIAKGHSRRLVQAELGLAGSTIKGLKKLFAAERKEVPVTTVTRPRSVRTHNTRRDNGIAAIRAGQSIKEVAKAFGVSINTVYIWRRLLRADNQNTPSAGNDNRPAALRYRDPEVAKFILAHAANLSAQEGQDLCRQKFGNERTPNIKSIDNLRGWHRRRNKAAGER